MVHPVVGEGMVDVPGCDLPQADVRPALQSDPRRVKAKVRVRVRVRVTSNVTPQGKHHPAQWNIGSVQR